MKAKPQMRLAWHKLMQEGKTPEQIAFQYGEHEFVVVKTLRHGTPKIEGANYKHLLLPIPANEIGEAFYEGTEDDLAKKYGVSVNTLRARLDDPVQRKDRKEHTRKIDKISDKDKTQAVNAYYQSGRKLNCTKYTSNILRQILNEQGVSEKVGSPISSRYVVRLMDAYMSIKGDDLIPVSHIREAQRLFVNFTSDNPLVWKGQVLDLLFNLKISDKQARGFSRAIDLVAGHLKMGNESNADH
jgi:hypothetical protein